MIPTPIVFLSATDDGPNREVTYFLEGQIFIQLASESRTNFITTDQVGFGILTLLTTPRNIDLGMNLLSWEES